MRRVLATLLAAGAVLAGALALLGAGGSSDAGHYRVVLDNAFGLTKGADVRVAGVKVGKVGKLDVDARTARAIVRADIDRPEFGGLRRDAFCTVKPQSLIGEYFLDCEPGSSPRRLPDGGTVPVSQTAGTIPPDLVLDILRRPYRQRLGILLSELGGGFAARGGDVNEAIGRAIPALRETDQVLNVLSGERRTIAALTRDAAATLKPLAERRDDVARFVRTAGAAASASADRRTQLAGTIARLPRFQEELRATLRDLGATAAAQTPALQALTSASPRLTTILDRLGPFADASRPFLRSLGRTSVTGTRAVRTARPTVKTLRDLSATTLEPSRNLRFILEHLDDRSFAVEPNPRSPGGKGFTGLEALLQYPFEQSQAINLFDARGYFLKIALLINTCSKYTDAKSAASDPARTKACSAALGPGGPMPATTPTRAKRSTHASHSHGSAPARGQAPATPAAPSTPTAPAPAPAQPTGPLGLPGELKIPGLPPIRLPGGGQGTGRQGGGGNDNGGVGRLLDFLLKP